MSTKARIVVVEDEPEICRFLESALKGQGYDVTPAEAGKPALKLCSAHPPDLMILDLGLPDMDGKDVIRELRGWSRMPVLVLSARDQEAEKVAALEAGADDYLTKPFGTQELLARVKVALRHAARRDSGAAQAYTRGGLVIDLERR